MTAWWEQGFVCLDTETDAPDPEQAQLGSICRAVINPSARSTDVRTAYVAIDMPAEASAVNGLTTEFLAAKARDIAYLNFKYAERKANAVDRRLSSLQSIGKSVNSAYNAGGNR